MKWLIVVVVGTIGVVVISSVVGTLLPKNHLASRAALFHRSPQELWEAMTNYQEFPSWRTDIVRTEGLADPSATLSWREFSKGGQQIPYVTVESVSQRRLVTRIANPKLSFGGSWTYELTPVNGGTNLRITENGEVYNPLFRFMSRFVFGHASSIEAYLNAMGNKFQEKVQVLK